MRVNAAALLVLITVSAGCASGTEQIARVRALEAESAARLSIEGQVLYGTDTAKQDGYQYCTLAVGLLDRGELRLAIREASKALYLGQAGGDRCLVASQRRLASAYNLPDIWSGRRVCGGSPPVGVFIGRPRRRHGPRDHGVRDVSLLQVPRMRFALRGRSRTPRRSAPLPSILATPMSLGDLTTARRHSERRH